MREPKSDPTSPVISDGPFMASLRSAARKVFGAMPARARKVFGGMPARAALGTSAVIALLLAAAPLWIWGASSEAGTAETGHLRVSILDASNGDPTAARVHLSDAQGHAAPLPDEAVGIMYGMWDHADGFGYQPDGSFYVSGSFDLQLPPGSYHLHIAKGNEFIAVRDTIEIRTGSQVDSEYRLERWIDAPSMGWYSADGHIHIRRSPREDPLLMTWIQAEDVHVGNMLRMGDFWATYYQQYAFGEAGAYQEGDYIVVAGQEDPRTLEIGHVLGLGASRPVRFRDRYYLYDLVLDSIRALGGVAGYAHQAETFHGYRGLTLDGLRDKVDLVELVQFCAPGGPLITEHYYFLLNLGFQATAVAGSDFPWCGKPHDGSAEIPVHEEAQIGNARFYTYLPDGLSFGSWIDALRMGRTFATSGPLLLLEVNGRPPGSEIDVRPGENVVIEATAHGHPAAMPLDRLEIVSQGDVIASATAGEEGQSADRLRLRLSLTPEHGIWIAARTQAGPMQVAHTTPVYVRVDGDGFHDRDAKHELLNQAEQYLDHLQAELDHPHEDPERQAWRYKDGLTERIEATRRAIEAIRALEN